MDQIRGFVVLLIIASIVAVGARWVRISSMLALLLLGLGLGTIPIVPVPAPNSDVILLLFLPPLLFAAAFVLDLRLLWSVRVGVFALALPGVLLAMAVAGTLVHWVFGMSWSVALLFGAIVAATDPVAVLATFRRLGVDKRLAVLIEGESLFNDGVALVLVLAMVNAIVVGFDFGSTIGQFILSVAAGTAIGVGLGWVGHRLIALVDDHLTEMSVSVATAYGAFLAAETWHFSGVLATVAAAMTLGHLGRTRGWIFSDDSERLLIDLWEYLAFIANAALFVLMGLTVRYAGLREHPEAVFVGIVAAIAGRAAVAYGLGSVLPWLGLPLAVAERHLLFWGGLRGAVALAAVLSLPSTVPLRAELLAMTYGVVLFTLLVQGLTIAPLARRLGLVQATPLTRRSIAKEGSRLIDEPRST